MIWSLSLTFSWNKQTDLVSEILPHCYRRSATDGDVCWYWHQPPSDGEMPPPHGQSATTIHSGESVQHSGLHLIGYRGVVVCVCASDPVVYVSYNRAPDRVTKSWQAVPNSTVPFSQSILFFRHYPHPFLPGLWLSWDALHPRTALVK